MLELLLLLLGQLLERLSETQIAIHGQSCVRGIAKQRYTALGPALPIFTFAMSLS